MRQQLGLLVLTYLRLCARLQLRKQLYGQIIGITGSAGKSSTRNAIYTVLAARYSVKASFGANSESGIPLDILGLSMRDYSVFDWLRVLLLAPWQLLTNWQKFDYYLVEMGIDSPLPPKNMAYLLSIIRPQIGVFLGAGINHAFAFDYLLADQKLSKAAQQQRLIALIAAEKAKLILSLPADGLALLNANDANVMQTCKGSKAKQLTFGSGADTTLQLLQQSIELTGNQLTSRFTWQSNILTKQQISLEFDNYFLFGQYAASIAPAILLGLRAGLSLSEIRKILERDLQLPASRASILAGRNDSLIIDSSYNASSMLPMLTAFLEIKQQTGRKLVLLGDMRELGESTQNVHQQLTQLLIAKKVEQVYLVGETMRQVVLPILETSGIAVKHFDNSTLAGQALAAELLPGDLLLVKGSQNTIFLEEAIKKLLAQPQKDTKKLCRQSQWWLQVKEVKN